MASLKVRIREKTSDMITLEIRKEDFEAFCAASGLYRKEFLDILEASDRDHKAGRVTERKGLHELIEEE